MRCKCNSPLSDYDMSVRHAVTGEYLGMCGTCREQVSNIVPEFAYYGNDRLDHSPYFDEDDLTFAVDADESD